MAKVLHGDRVLLFEDDEDTRMLLAFALDEANRHRGSRERDSGGTVLSSAADKLVQMVVAWGQVNEPE